ncbi:hypothetical protein M1M07_06900 [Rhodococcus sp. HM1]|uniref:TPR repeat region-containing protein n=1 Tax=Rhodococcus sp. HM1 TaxID=2937759 RepID=UPI00200B9841|nr:hypothetical protein [Rhodococcus sp. HM1]MCK8670844.1 hypothetical protein [Rhodococcus sp. HM1]
MTPTQTSVARWQPQHLGGTADAIDGAQRRLAAIARSVHRDVSLMRDHDYWVSDAQVAAEERAEFESRRMLRCAEGVETVGGAYRSALGSIGAARTHLLDTVAAAHAAGASVGDDWQVAAGSVEDPQEVDYWRWRVGQAVTALTDADADAARAVRNALDALRALVPEQLGTSGLEARELAVKITGGAHLTAADIDNLLRDLRGIQPTAEQLEALARGEHIVMSQATLDYVRELYGTLGVDGFVKLSEQVSMEGSAEGQRLLANGLALASGPETGSGGMPAGVAEFFDKPATTGVLVGNPPVFLTAVPDSGLLDRFAQSEAPSNCGTPDRRRSTASSSIWSPPVDVTRRACTRWWSIRTAAKIGYFLSCNMIGRIPASPRWRGCSSGLRTMQRRPVTTPRRSNMPRAQAKPLSAFRNCCPNIMGNCSTFPAPTESRSVS